MPETFYLDKKVISADGSGQTNQYFLMGIDLGDVNILSTSLQILIDKFNSKTDLHPEERDLYKKVLRLKSILKTC